MANPTSTFEIGDLRFRGIHPGALANRFEEIQDLRHVYYKDEFNRRPEEQIRHFVGRLSLDNWRDPNVAIGKTATAGQRRMNPRVVAAFKIRTDEIVGYAYASENVSSKLERKLDKYHVPGFISGRVGDIERDKKIQKGRYYVWGSEFVYDRERVGLPSLLVALTFEGFNSDKSGTWYPWDEQVELKESLASWGYDCDEGEPVLVGGDRGFGIESPPTRQERWVVPSLNIVKSRMAQVTGLADAIEAAHESMSP